MNLLTTPPTGRNGTPDDGDLDGLLGAFFKAQMPQPWPAFEPPAEEPATLMLRPRGRRALSRSRLALAASVALLVAGGWALLGRFGDPAGGPPPLRHTHPTANKDDRGRLPDEPMRDIVPMPDVVPMPSK